MTTSLQQAAKAAIERWDSPAWKDQPHTAEFIEQLRKALDAELALTAERDEWKARCEFSFEQRDKLTAERDALKTSNDSYITLANTAYELTEQRTAEHDALKDAARLALDALEKSTPKPRKGDDDYCELGWRDQSYAIAALKAVL